MQITRRKILGFLFSVPFLPKAYAAVKQGQAGQGLSSKADTLLSVRPPLSVFETPMRFWVCESHQETPNIYGVHSVYSSHSLMDGRQLEMLRFQFSREDHAKSVVNELNWTARSMWEGYIIEKHDLMRRGVLDRSLVNRPPRLQELCDLDKQYLTALSELIYSRAWLDGDVVAPKVTLTADTSQFEKEAEALKQYMDSVLGVPDLNVGGR